MLKVVVDTSVWLSGIFWHGTPHRILEAWKAGDVEIVTPREFLKHLPGTP